MTSEIKKLRKVPHSKSNISSSLNSVGNIIKNNLLCKSLDKMHLILMKNRGFLLKRYLKMRNKITFVNHFLLSLSILLSINSISFAEDNIKYYCRVQKGVPKTFVNTKDGRAMIINWRTDGIGGLTAKERCEEVSKRFQENYEENQLVYIVTGEINNKPVLCAVPNQIRDCSDLNILVTLNSNLDRFESTGDLLEVNDLIEFPLDLSGDCKITFSIRGEDYYNINNLIYARLRKQGRIKSEEIKFECHLM